MMNRLSTTLQIALTGAAAVLLLETASAAPFVFNRNDLALGFRSIGGSAKYEVAVNLGPATNYFGPAVGTTITITNFSASQLTPSTFANLNNLSWSVFGWYNSGYGSSYPAAVRYTLWVTVPRANSAVRSADALRLDSGSLLNGEYQMNNITVNAAFVSSDLGSSGTYNTASFVREDTSTYSQHLLSIWMGGVADPTVGTMNDQWPTTEPNGGNLENRTPASFTGAVRSDLYEVRPLYDASGNLISDPHTGTSGLAWYIGYFEFRPDGTMTFTREAASTPPVPPSPVKLSIARTSNTNTISFASSSGVTYKLCFTNSAGLTTPVSAWPQSGTISGDGTKKSFQDSTTDPMRLYRVLEE